MLDVHHLEDGCAVVGDGHVVVCRDHHLVKPLGPQRGAQGVGHGAGGHDVALNKEERGEKFYLTQKTEMSTNHFTLLFISP